MKIQLIASILCIFTLLPCTLLMAQEPEEDTSNPSLRVLEIDDTFKIKHVDHPELSPDGKWVAYTVSTQNFEKNSSKTRTWMMATENGEPISKGLESFYEARFFKC